MEVTKNSKKISELSDININFKKKLSKNDHIFKNYIIKKVLQNKKRELKLSLISLEKLIKLQHGETFEIFLKKFSEKNIEITFKEKGNFKTLYFVIISSYFLEDSNVLITVSEEIFNIFCNKNYKYESLNLNALLSFTNKSTQNLFIYLQKKYINNYIEISLTELKNILEIDELYPRFYDLEKNILVPALKEISVFFDNKITYRKIRENSFINSKIIKIEFNFNNSNSYDEVIDLFPLIDNFPNNEALKNILVKSSGNYEYLYLKRNLEYTLLHQEDYDNFDEALTKNIFYNSSETFFKTEIIKYQKNNIVLYKESKFYTDLEKFKDEIFKKIKAYNIENVFFILNIIKISLNIFSQIYKNNEILKNPVYHAFFYDLERKGRCHFENENYIIIAEFNSNCCESHFVILKK